MRCRVACAAAWIALCVASCADGSAERGALPRDAARSWLLSSAPVLEIGAIDGVPEEVFGTVAGAVRLGDGSLVVGDGTSLELRYFDAAGEHLVTSGRAGDGPGEFRSIAYVGWAPGDTVVVYDGVLRRFSVFDGSGAFVRQFRVDPDVFQVPAGRLSDGRYVMQVPTIQAGFDDRRDAGPARDSVALVFLNASGRAVDTLGVYPNMLVHTIGLVVGGEAMAIAVPVPLTTATSVAVGGDWVYSGFTARYEIDAVHWDGTTRHTISRQRARRLVTRAEVSAALEAVEEGMRADDPYNREVMDAYRAMELPDSMPAFARLVADRADLLWVADVPAGDAVHTPWTVFEPTGVVAARVSTPRELRVLDIGTDYVLGIVEGSFGVQRVVVYGLARGDGEHP